MSSDDRPTVPPQVISAPEAPPRPSVDPYEVGELLGEGGMGRVYRAVHQVTRRPCALKLLAPALTRQPDFVSRFRSEAQTLARLNHPNIVQIYTGGESHGHYFLEMEMVDGGDLQKRVVNHFAQHKQGLPEAEVLRVADAVLAALEYAHGKKVVHRDLKPANILMSGTGEVKVSDFGLASVIGEDVHRTQIQATIARPGIHQVTSMETVPFTPAASSGSFAGTILYMSPQALRDEPPDPRDDIFSLGVAVYFMLVGRTPAVSYTPIQRQRPALERDWDAFIGGCLAEDLSQRYPTAAAARQALQNALKPKPRRRAWVPITVATGVLLVLGAGAWYVRWRPAATPEASATVADTTSSSGAGQAVGGEAGDLPPRIDASAPSGLTPASGFTDGGAGAPPISPAGERVPPAAPAPDVGQAPVFEPTPAVVETAPSIPRVTREVPRVAVELPAELTVSLPGGIPMTFRRVPAGRMMLGSPRGEMGHMPDEAQRWYAESRGFLMGQTEVTQAQYEALTGRQPSYYRAGNGERPVERIQYSDVAEYTSHVPGTFLGELNKLLESSGHYDWQAGLPTEEEWEYACRAGSPGSYHDGGDLSLPMSLARIDTVAVYGKSQTSPVASRAPNAWGLYDMHGNVAEWTEGGVLRGGSFWDPPARIRAAARVGAADAQTTADRRYGFRVILRPRD
jgi:formylglycine-generating enzyme required for sulfatase activity/predicted Ser/Thr protein kinase